MRKAFLIPALLLLAVSSAQADFFSISLFQNATDNLFQDSLSEGDRISSLIFEADKSFSGLTLFAQGRLSHFSQYGDLTNYYQDVGLDYVLFLGGGTAAYFALTGRGAFYKEDYRDFNHTSLKFDAALKSYLSQVSIFKSNYILELKNYGSPLFDSTSHTLDVSLDYFFQTRTTVKLETSWGAKTFLHPFSTEDSGSSAGEASFQNGQGLLKGMGQGKGKNFPSADDPEEAAPGSGQGIQYLALGGTVAQGLSDRIGLQLQALRQWSISGLNPFTTVGDFYWVENPSYDRFSWEGTELGGMLTVLAPWSMQLNLRYEWSRKEFPGILTLDPEGAAAGIARRDRRDRLAVRLEKNFTRFSIFLDYSYLNNASNDAVFTWKGNFFSVGFAWHFFKGD